MNLVEAKEIDGDQDAMYQLIRFVVVDDFCQKGVFTFIMYV